jgi:hypothetical protein
MADDTIDLELIIDEIDDEVRRRRAEGGLDPEWERELDELFALGAPRGVADFGRLLDEAQRAAQVDATPPSQSQRPGGEAVKRALGRTMSWYVSNVTRQVSALGTDLVEVVRILGERVARLERNAEPDGPAGRASLLDPHVDLAPWAGAITDALRPASGRVLHGDAGDGVVVGALLDGGVDAYGVEQRPALAERAAIRNLDVREESVAQHLATLPPGSLGGLVLSGCVDTLANGPREELVRSARRAVAPGGLLAVITSDPQRWGDAATCVVADLSPGRPWHLATWSYLLANRGFDLRPEAPGAVEGEHVLVAVRRPA